MPPHLSLDSGSPQAQRPHAALALLRHRPERCILLNNEIVVVFNFVLRLSLRRSRLSLVSLGMRQLYGERLSLSSNVGSGFLRQCVEIVGTRIVTVGEDCPKCGILDCTVVPLLEGALQAERHGGRRQH
jgi:hypothetical protein